MELSTGTVMGLLQQFGIVPTIILIMMMTWFFLREIRKEVGTLKTQIDEMRREFLSALSDIKKRSDDGDERISVSVKEVETRVNCIEKEYVPRDDHYRDIGGWREEMMEMRGEIQQLQLAVNLVGQMQSAVDHA